MDQWIGSSIQDFRCWDCTESSIPVLSEQWEIAIDAQPSEPFVDGELWMALPDDMWERILALLPVTYVIRAQAVCKRWKSIISSKRFSDLCAEAHSTKPWYFMYKDYKNERKYGAGVAHDPAAKKWHKFELPLGTSGWLVASSNGIICFMDNSDGNSLYLCNPMSKTWQKLPEPSERWNSDYYSVSITFDKLTSVRTTVVARSKQVPADYSRWHLSIDTHDSVSNSWGNAAKTLLHGWRSGENSIICNGTLYCVIHSTAMVGCGGDTIRHGLVTYRLSDGVLDVGSVAMPCSLTCVKLMNCRDQLVMVGGIGRSDIIKGIGIWVLDSAWREIAKLPNKFFRGFGEFDDVFASCGSGDLIYIQSFGSPLLLLYDMEQGTWRWCYKCPLVKKHPLHLFTGFCFEPRLEVGT